MKTIFGTKISSTRRYTQDGSWVPVSMIKLYPMVVTQLKNTKRDGYQAIQFGLGEKSFKNVSKALKGYLKGAKLDKAPLYFHEVRVEDISKFKTGDRVSPATILQAGDLVNISGKSKGKGFAGVMKRWNFAGGPRTHGQSDRERAPGSIGQTTTPGRVFKGKKMAGRLGGVRKTVRNLTVLKVDEEKGLLLVKGLVPGARGVWLEIRQVGKTKKYSPLLEKGEKIKVMTKKEEKKAPEKEPETKEVKEKNAEN